MFTPPTISYYKAIQINALHAVLNPDNEYNIRKVLRWYSSKFNTALHLVYELPLEHVLQTYYEAEYAEADAEDIERIKNELLESDAARQQRLLGEDSAKAEADNFAKEIEAKQKKKVGDVTQDPKSNVRLGNTFALKEADLPTSPKEMPPDIKISFISDEEFEKEIGVPKSSFGLLD